jgi:hypothetical protein
LPRLVHIINPTNVSESSDLYKAQPITVESILNAKHFCKTSSEIQLAYTHFEEEHIQLQQPFKKLSYLSNSIHNILINANGNKLPLLAEILEKTAEMQADYIIYTNIDIGLMPHFYDDVLNRVSQGHDALVINRRRISKRYFENKPLSDMYADIGFSHPGFDCFVFHKDLLQKFVMDGIVIGIPFVEATLVYNISAFAQNPAFIADKHLTFHIGLDVMPQRNKTYYKHNRGLFFNKILPALYPKLSIKKLPYASLPFPVRAIKWILNPVMFTRLFVLLELKSLSGMIQELRWRMLQR